MTESRLLYQAMPARLAAFVQIESAPFLVLVEGRIRAIALPDHCYLVALQLANAGQSELVISHLDPSARARSCEILWGNLSIPAHCPGSWMIVRVQLDAAARDGNLLFTILSNAKNAPEKHIVFSSRDINSLWPGDQGEFLLPLLDQFFTPQSTIRHPILDHVMDPANLLGDYPLEVAGTQAEDIRIYGKSFLADQAGLWGHEPHAGHESRFVLSLNDGRYYFHYRDRENTFIDPIAGDELLFADQTVYSVLDIQRDQLAIRFLNCLDRVMYVHLQCDEPWLVPPSDDLRIEPKNQMTATCRIQRTELAPGMHHSLIALTSPGASEKSFTLDLGMQCVLPHSAIFLEFPRRDQVVHLRRRLWGTIWKFPIKVRCMGSGHHVVTIRSDADGQFQFFNIDQKESGTQERELIVQIDTAQLPSYQKRLSVFIDTSCYLGNKRFVELALQLEHPAEVKWEPGYLNFIIHAGSAPQTRYIRFYRTDQMAVNIELTVSDILAPFLILEKHNNTMWQIRTNKITTAIESREIFGQLRFVDNRSMFESIVPVIMNFIK